MYICDSCGATFGEPRLAMGELTEHFGAVVRMPDYYVCPNCGMEDFEEADTCPMCGKVKKLDEIEMGACSECAKPILRKLAHFGATLSEGEKNYLNNFVLEMTDEGNDVF